MQVEIRLRLGGVRVEDPASDVICPFSRRGGKTAVASFGTHSNDRATLGDIAVAVGRAKTSNVTMASFTPINQRLELLADQEDLWVSRRAGIQSDGGSRADAESWR